MMYVKQLVKQIFQYEARLILKKFKPKIIAISGSVGKSTTRDAIYLVLSKSFFIRKSEKSFTTELGIPLTIIGCHCGTGSILQWCKNILVGLNVLFFTSQYPEWLLLEIDGDRPGDFEGLSDWFHPNILVMTAMGEIPAHVEVFGTMEKFLLEKKKLLDTVTREGTVIYNIDDFHTANLVAQSTHKKVSCGVEGKADIYGNAFTILYGNSNGRQIPTGMMFEIMGEKLREKPETYREKPMHNIITIFNSVGIHNEYACLLATAVGQELGVSNTQILASLSRIETLPGRMKIISGIKDTVIIDDSYNASPVAMKESLQTFLSISTSGRKIVVLGDMMSLGKYSVDEHKKIASLVISVHTFISVGIRARGIADELVSLGFPESHILSVDTAQEAGRELQLLLEPGDSVFIKGSQSLRMERTVEEIMRHPQDKKILLTRQDEEWLERN